MESVDIPRSWAWLPADLVLIALFAARAIGGFREGDLIDAFFGVAFVLWCFISLIRSAVTPFVRIDSQGITYYGDLRTRSVDWEAIRRVELGRYKLLRVTTRDARQVDLPLGAVARSQRELLLRVVKERLERSLTSASS